VDELIRTMPQVATAWVEDSQERKASFDDLLRSNSCAGLIVIIKTLNEHKAVRQARGKTLHVADEAYLREAQRLLYDEFAGALGILPSEVNEYIRKRLDQIA
jgi:CarD family transcriptional regulator